jgi:hypothetical protein
MTDNIENFYDTEILKRNEKLSAEGKRIRQREISDLRRILKLPEGRRFIWNQLGKAGIFHDSFSLNSNQTGYNLGKRSMGLDLLIDLNEADVGAFAQLQSEYMSEVTSRKNELNKEDPNGGQ